MNQQAELKNLAIEVLQRGKFQPRREFNPESLEELAASIKSTGLIQPIVVRPISGSRFEIIAGERRWRAAQLAGMTEVSCLVKAYSDEEAAEAAIIENLQREDLNPIEEAHALQKLIDEFDYIHEEIATALGKSRTRVTNSLRLLQLEPQVQQFLSEKRLTGGHGKVLASLKPREQREMASKAIKYAWSVRKIEQEAKKLQLKLSDEPRRDPNLSHLESSLGKHIGSRVNIDWNNDKRGELKIQFHNLDILQGLLNKMGYETD